MALTKVVESNPPFHTMVAPLAKLLPFAVKVNCAPPTVAVFGLNDTSTGVFGAPMVNRTAFDVVVPVATVTLAAPAVTSNVLDTDACNWVGLINEVTSVFPFHWTSEALVKAEPLTKRMKLGPPGAAELGLRLEMFGPDATAIVNVSGLEVPDVGVVTDTFAVPLFAIRLPATVAVNCVGLTYVVTNSEPFQSTAELVVKFEPFTVNVNCGPPGGVVAGLNEDSTGNAVAEMVNVRALDVADPALVTVTFAVPTLVSSVPGTPAVNCAALTKVVASNPPFHWIAEELLKPEPFTVSVKDWDPGATDAGFSDVIAGPVEETIGNATTFEVPAPGLLTATFTEPAAVKRLLATVAFSCVALTNVVGSSVLFH